PAPRPKKPGVRFPKRTVTRPAFAFRSWKSPRASRPDWPAAKKIQGNARDRRPHPDFRVGPLAISLPSPACTGEGPGGGVSASLEAVDKVKPLKLNDICASCGCC